MDALDIIAILFWAFPLASPTHAIRPASWVKALLILVLQGSINWLQGSNLPSTLVSSSNCHMPISLFFNGIPVLPTLREEVKVYYSRSNDPNSRSVQNIFRALTNSGLFGKCKKTDLICKNNKTYETLHPPERFISQN